IDRNVAPEKSKKPPVDFGGTTDCDLFTTSERPENIEKVPSVMMIDGSRRPTVRSPFVRPRPAPKRIPRMAASHGSIPAIIAFAVITAEKLKFQPTERSISPRARRK